MNTKAQMKHEAFTRQFYGRSPRISRSAVRSGLGDAAHLCDAIADDICDEKTVRGKLTKEGIALIAALKRVSDAIWTM